MVENIGDCVAHVEHREAQTTGFLIGANAALVCHLAHAPNGRQRPVERADNLPQRDLVGMTRQIITTVRAQPTVQETGIFEGEEDLLEKLDRYFLAFGDLSNLYDIVL